MRSFRHNKAKSQNYQEITYRRDCLIRIKHSTKLCNNYNMITAEMKNVWAQEKTLIELEFAGGAELYSVIHFSAGCRQEMIQRHSCMVEEYFRNILNTKHSKQKSSWCLNVLLPYIILLCPYLLLSQLSRLYGFILRICSDSGTVALI